MSTLTIALAQIAPVLLDRAATLAKVEQAIVAAAQDGAQLVAFGEALVPGYPFWLSLMQASAFDDRVQKEIHARYLREGVDLDAGDLDGIRACAKTHRIAVYLGVMERPLDRAGQSLYCSLVYIDAEGVIQSVHRKLQPTYEERLAWSPGDGHGLRVHELGAFHVGGLNCWENWMPLPRAALYGQGETLHVAVWPGALRNTIDLTRHIAREGRLFSASVSGVMRTSDVPADFPHRALMLANAPAVLADGGSCLAAPDGTWIIEPQVGSEGVFCAEINLDRVREERQNFDPSGHYSRPDVTQLVVDRTRQRIVKLQDKKSSNLKN